MTRFTKAAAGIAGGVALTALAAAPAFGFAAPSITSLSSPSDLSGTTNVVEIVRGAGLLDSGGNALPNDQSGDTLTINYSGLPTSSTTPLAIKGFLCRPTSTTATAASFNPASMDASGLDCIDLPNATSSSTTGAGTMTGVRVGDGGFFKNHDGQRAWECAAAPTGSIAGTVDPNDYGNGPGASKLYTDCFVVIRNVSANQNSKADADNEVFPVRFVAATTTPPQDVPEAPYAALLPAAAIAVAGGSYLIVRRRGAAA